MCSFWSVCVVVYLENPTGLITWNTKYFSNCCLKEWRDDLRSEGREFQRREVLNNGETLPEQCSMCGMHKEMTNWEWVAIAWCVLFAGDLRVYCLQNKGIFCVVCVCVCCVRACVHARARVCVCVNKNRQETSLCSGLLSVFIYQQLLVFVNSGVETLSWIDVGVSKSLAVLHVAF